MTINKITKRIIIFVVTFILVIVLGIIWTGIILDIQVNLHNKVHSNKGEKATEVDVDSIMKLYEILEDAKNSQTNETNSNEKATISEKGVITFPDKAFEKGIRKAIHKPEGDILKSDLQTLAVLEISNTAEDISNISGIEFFTNLTTLDLFDNKIEDITPLENLSNLKRLALQSNRIEDISPLSKLTNLEFLNLSENKIKDVNPLKYLINLKSLSLKNNKIKDFSPVEKYYHDLTEKDFELNK